jgi:flagellar biosynthesis protein FlhB
MIPKLEKFNPAKGLKRMFAEMKTYVELIKSVMKMTVVALVVYIVISSEIEKIITLSYRQPAAIAMVIGGFLAKCTFAVAPVFFAIAVLDLLYQRWQFSKDQRMTKDEVKREHKDSEGDPQHKQARQSAHQEILNDNMVQSVRKADAVVTNPTHIACALKYDPDEENAPRLIAKGQGWLADQIKQVAKEEDIPIVRDKSLARALYEMQLDEQISEDMFDAVAEVLRWVEMIARSRGEVPAWVQDGDPGQGGQGGAPAGPKSYYG